nr:glycosyltransferase [uncultured Empedobacter sp.]
MINRKPLVSVILPVYNAGQHLYDCVNSIINQTFINFEFIIINDGSTDNSLEILKSFSDPRIIIIDQKNKGLIASLNIGILHSTGKYIARMDADDIAFRDRFERQVNFLENNEDYVVCSSSRITFIDSIAETNKRLEVLPDNFEVIKVQTIFNSPFTHPAAMFRTSTLKDNHILFDEDYKYAEDYIFWVHLLKYGKGFNFRKPLIYYRVSPTSQTGIASKNIEERKKIILKIQLKALEEFNIKISGSDQSLLYSLSLTSHMQKIAISDEIIAKYLNLMLDLYKKLKKAGYSNGGRIVIGRVYFKFFFYNVIKVHGIKQFFKMINFKLAAFGIYSVLKF